MIRFLAAILFSLLCGTALSAPQCVPLVYGVQVGNTYGERTDVGRFLHWYCRSAETGALVPEGLSCVHGTCIAVGTFFSQLDAMKQQADPAAAVKAAWDASFPPCSLAPNPSPLRSVCNQMYESMRVNWPVAAIPPSPPASTPPAYVPTHVVKINTACKVEPCSRPAYELKEGVLGTKEIARAPVGVACNVSRPTKPSGTSGDVWAEFGPTYVQGWVALCTPKPK